MSSPKREKDKIIRERVCRNIDKLIRNKWPNLTDKKLGVMFSEKPTTVRSYRGLNKNVPSISPDFLIRFAYISETSIDDLMKKDL